MGWDSIANAVTSVDAAIQVIKAIRAADGAIERAEMRFKLAEMMEALTDAKEALVESRQARQDSMEEIQRLEEALRTKGNLVRVGDAYYEVGPDGSAIGDPHCAACWEARHALYHLVRGDRADTYHHCPICAKKYGRQQTRFAIEQPRA